MKKIDKEYALELANLYGIEYELLSEEEIMSMPEEDKFNYSEIPSILGINDDCHWFSISSREKTNIKKSVCIKGCFNQGTNYFGDREDKGALAA